MVLFIFLINAVGIRCCSKFRSMNPVVRSDIVVSRFLDSVGGYRHKERRDKLLDILDVDLDWYADGSTIQLLFMCKSRHMHTMSDGERRRGQLTMGLMQPWDLLLLDEVGNLAFIFVPPVSNEIPVGDGRFGCSRP